MLVTVFISHSKRDEELIRNVRDLLKNVGHTPIIEEFIPEEKQDDVPHNEISKNVEKSDAMMLFLTDNVVMTPYTQNWINYEVGLARGRSIRLFVFERIGSPISFPIPYLTDYALFDMNQTKGILELQKMAKNFEKTNKAVLTAISGAALGTVFGPAGIVLGALGGYLIGPKQSKPPGVRCDNCHIKFNYHSTHKRFCCPSCRHEIHLGD